MTGSNASLKTLVVSVVVVVAVLALALLYLPAASATTATPTYPVTVTVSPKAHTYTLGQSPGVVATEANGGSQMFKATKCVVEVKVPGSSKYVSGSCPGFAPFSVKPGATAKQHYSVYPYKVTMSTPKGIYDLKGYFVGTVLGVTHDTGTVSFTLTVS